MSKEQSSIPISKVQRASKFIKTGAKVGGNYLKYYGKKMINPEHSREELNQDNASDIYSSLSQLKGSALKVAQMLSMDKSIMPEAYQEKFSMAQYSAPPLSYPLVVKTFQKYFGKSPEKIFDTFSKSAVNAASIGQVHKASLNGKEFAVKVQYPGVKESISSDLRMVRPIATAMFKINPMEMEEYVGEVEGKLIEETDYSLELKRSVEISENCSHIEDLVFPQYHADFSSEKILVMDWLDGHHLKEWLETNPSQEERNRLGQALWDFYDHQVHNLKQVHADPHPGNFLFRKDGKLGVLDFGCVKVIPEDFYKTYFKLMKSDVLNPDFDLEGLFFEIGFLNDQDSKEDKAFFTTIFKEMVELLGRPFRSQTFDFGNKEFFDKIYAVGERLSNMKEFRDSKTARGNKHGLYINRTYFGLYNILHELRSEIKTA